ncbi:LADA_0D03180g1_1 [Lachancea dasiensis]|uniref:E3 ubiquitin-protein ligase listerin n=1 Tax=Lachancea dasiensis TaxID=1072105 RepID=A0A1G4J4G9_9SACH|nr:LADA_0D03180g1_1 [Lachancea dasiensis]
MSFALVSDFGLGNNGVRISLNFFDGIIEQSLLSALGSAELQLIFKSLLKRDETTKEKALLDLSDLLANVDQNKCLFEDECFALCWSQIYAKLLTNESRNIRILSHTITTDLIKLLGKKGGRYLKDFVPLLLSGTYEYDSAVSKVCLQKLMECFGNDPAKVRATWKIFQSQILKFIEEVIIVETPESLSDVRYVTKQDAELKYTRIATSAICVIDRLVKECPAALSSEDQTCMRILVSDDLWRLMSLKSIHDMKACGALLNLIGTLWDAGFLESSKEIIKLPSKRLLKSMGQLSPKNALGMSPLFPSILTQLSRLIQYKNGKILSLSKSSREIILNFLTLGAGNADASYYSLLLSFFKKNSENLNLDYKLDCLKIWQKGVEYECNRRGVPINCSLMLHELWKNYLTFLSLAPEGFRDEARAIGTKDILVTLGKKSLNIPDDTIRLFAASLDCDDVKKEIQKLMPTGCSESHKDRRYIDNIISIAFAKASEEPFLNEISQSMILSLQEHEFCHSHYGYSYFIRLIKARQSACKLEILPLLNLLSQHLTLQTFEGATKVFITFSRVFPCDPGNELGILDIFGRFIDSFLSLDIARGEKLSFLDQLDQTYLAPLMGHSQSLQTFENGLIVHFDFSDEALFKSQLINENNVLYLYKESMKASKLSELCHYCSIHKPELLEYLLLNSDIIVNALFISDENGEMIAKVLQLSKDNDEVAAKAGLAVSRHVRLSQAPLKGDILDFVRKQLEANTSFLDVLIPGDIHAKLDEVLPEMSYQMAMSCSLDLNVHLLQPSCKGIDWSMVQPAIREAQFLDTLLTGLPEYLNDDIVLYLTFISELASDFNYFSPEPLDEYQDFECVLFKVRKYDFEAHTIIRSLLSDHDTESRIMQLLTKTEGLSAVALLFNFRILKQMLVNAIDCAAPTVITADIEKYIMTTVRKNMSDAGGLMKVATFLAAVVRFNNCEPLSKIRNYLASELIGARGSELTTRVPIILILLNNMLKLDSNVVIDPSYFPIAPQRLNMILSEIGKWIESDLWYEDCCAVLRMALLEFFGALLTFSSLEVTSLIGPSFRILRDCVDIINVNEESYLSELKLRSVELFRRITAKKLNNHEKDQDTTEAADELFDNIFETLILRPDHDAESHFTYVFYKSLSSALHTVPKTKFLGYAEKLMEANAASDSLNLDQSRLIVSLLRQMILLKQQELLVEYELKNSSVGSEDVIDQQFQLPSLLLDKISHDMPKEYLEYENETQFLKYLWDCFLTFTYFEKISYNLRQNYIGQLRDQHLITKLFDFIADQLDLEDKSWAPSNSSSLLTYDISGLGFSSTKGTIVQECKFLLLHLLYVLFTTMGSLTSSWWLNLKDRNLQLKIEKFVTAHISPVLIQQELDNVGDKAKNLTDHDDSLSIRVNHVTNEIKAGYLVDEQKLEISLKLPSNYPLSNIEVHGISRVGINEQKWKSWILSAQRVIIGMNGSVMDSLELFTKNVNLHFSGFEECAICYSILHAVDRKLPTKVCPTCNNRFHGACLYKWFRSSGNNTCPLCRSEIPFRR